MYKDADTTSTASTLVPSPDPQAATRTTLTGRPITYDHDNFSNMYAGENFQVGANTLPPGYTDNSLVHIPIKTAKYLHQTASGSSTATAPASEIKHERSPGKGVWERISKRISGNAAKDDDDGGLRIVAMSRGDYLKYWAKGEDGKFRADVEEPAEGRAEWLASALERQEREGLGKVAPRRTQGTEGSAGAFGAAGAMIGSMAQ